jgi:tRNA(His) 5'-end guanylyltransferase
MTKYDKDSLGDRMKFYEGNGVGEQRLIPMVPVLARLDGKAFHTFTRGLRRPFDQRLSNLMVDTTKFLVAETNAKVGHTQSDEITLVWLTDSYDSEMYFDGRIQKLVSILAARCSVFFNRELAARIPEKADAFPVFDCRVWNVPNKTEAINALIWRQNDATRNSISMAAQANFSHKQLQGKSCDEMQKMLFQEKGINWNDYPDFFKRGTFVQRRTVVRPFTTDEIDKLPPKHEARRNPDLKIERSEIRVVEWPQLTKVINREDLVFSGADIPLTLQTRSPVV